MTAKLKGHLVTDRTIRRVRERLSALVDPAEVKNLRRELIGDPDQRISVTVQADEATIGSTRYVRDISHGDVSADPLTETDPSLAQLFDQNRLAYRLTSSFTSMAIIGALRYYMGRHTISTHAFANELADLIVTNQVGVDTLTVIERDVRQWLESNATCTFGGVDDRAPWKNLHQIVADKLADNQIERLP